MSEQSYMIASCPIDIPKSKAAPTRRTRTSVARVNNIVNACYGMSPTSVAKLMISSPSESSPVHNSPKRLLVIELSSPIKNYSTMNMVVRDALPLLSDDDLDFVINRLDKAKLAKIYLESTSQANESCFKLIENGVAAWVE